jgi:hypothetical protein
VVVAGQGLTAGDTASAAVATVATRAPSVPAISLAEPGNGTHMALLLTGANYGAVVSPCASDVAVTVAGAPCESLTIVQVGACSLNACTGIGRFFAVFGEGREPCTLFSSRLILSVLH